MKQRTISLLTLVMLTMLGSVAVAQHSAGVPTQWKPGIQRPAKDWDFDGKRILGHIDHDICLWDAATGELVQRMKGHRERIEKVQFSPDGQLAVSSSWISDGPMVPYHSNDTRTIVWDLSTGTRRWSWPDQVAGEFSPDGKRLVTFSRRPNQTTSFDASIWNIESGRLAVRLKLVDGSSPYWDSLHFSPDGTSLFHVTSRGATLFDARTGKRQAHIELNHGLQHFTSSGHLACFELGRDAGQITVVDVATAKTQSRFPHGQQGVWYGAWHHHGSKLAAFPIGGPLHIWNVATGRFVTGSPVGQYPYTAAIISTDNRWLAVTWGGANVENVDIPAKFGLYDATSGQEILVADRPIDSQLIGFSPDSETVLLVGSEATTYRAFDGRRLLTVALTRTSKRGGN